MGALLSRKRRAADRSRTVDVTEMRTFGDEQVLIRGASETCFGVRPVLRLVMIDAARSGARNLGADSLDCDERGR